MKNSHFYISLLLLGLPFSMATNADDFFEKQVRPLLVAKCLQCHSGTKTSGGLSLDSREGWARGGDSGPAIIPGDIDASLVIDAINYNGLEMPPQDKGGKLTPQEIEILTRWVRSGAADPRIAKLKIGGMSLADAKTWWAYQPIQPIPVTTESSRIDEYINQALAENNLQPVNPSTRRELIRRATYGLTGLPPTYQQVVDFETDTSPDAYDRVLNRLLASPRYGEHWGRHWLDVVRYADTAGENSDRPLPHAWRYRNWVIQSLNRDLPFDDFVQQQLAGDLRPLEDSTASRADGVIATGYLAIARRYGHNINKDVHLMYEDVIDNVGKSFLGLTLGCARCHDHKYDPVTAEDYYALYGIFSSTRFSFPGCEPIPQPSGLIDLIPNDLAQAKRDEFAVAMQQFKANQPNNPEEIARLKGEYAKSYEVLALVNVGEGTKETLEDHLGDKATRQIKKGEVLQLAILRNGNYGADTTRLEFDIQSTSDEAKRWSSNELIDVLDSTSPLFSMRDATWALLDVTNGPKFLIDKKTNIGGHESLIGWATGDNPSFFANTSESAVSAWTVLPSRAFFTHPGPAEDSGIAWICPEDGEYSISGFVSDAHPGGGDGVSYRLEHFTNPSLGNQLIAFGKANGNLEPPTPPVIPVAYAVGEGDVSDANLQERGDPELVGEVIPRRWLSAFGGTPLENIEQSGRSELATWITQHPLFTRVLANRIWHWHFGQGIVSTPNDFGSRGNPPSHPELLDFLAGQLRAHNYRLKPIHKMIMQSKAYQRSSAAPTKTKATDPTNTWLSHFSSRRLSAEEIRDSLLFASGELDETPGKAHPFPVETSWNFSQHAPFNAVYPTTRRSVYMMVQRQRRHPFLALFDGPDPNASTPVRGETTVPTQALYFLNDDFFHQASSTTTSRALTSESNHQVFDRLYQIILQRIANEREAAISLTFTDAYPGDTTEKWEAFTRALLSSNEFLYVD